MMAAYLHNRLPTKAVSKTPYEVWNGEKPDLKHIRAFGSKAYAHVPTEKRSKLDSHSAEGVFVGYIETSKGYRILDPGTGKVTISRTVTFDEGIATSHSQQFIHVSGTAQLDSTKRDDSQQFQKAVDNAKRIEIEIDEPSVSETSAR